MSLRNWHMAVAVAVAAAASLYSQSITGGTVSGTVTDPTGAVVPGVKVVMRNPMTGYEQTTATASDGAFRFNNVPFNPYTLTARAPGFTPFSQPVEIRGAQPVTVNISLELAGASTAVTVEAFGPSLETDPSAHADVDESSLAKLPAFDPGGALSQAVTYSTGGVAADANGFFHPVGDHAQTSFVIDGQHISDQQSKIFSTQIPANALQSMELITGSPDAEYGDKSSLVVNATTRSALGATKPFGSVETGWGSFGTWNSSASLGTGGKNWGNFVIVNGTRSGRFLDTPELLPLHDVGNNESIFDRLDWQPDAADSLHLDLFTARNWFQVPNSHDQLSQDQRQRVLTWNIAPGYQHVFNSHMLLTVNPYVRRDQVNYYASPNPLDDTPVTASQLRFLTNYGVNADLSYTHGRHEIKIGTQLQRTPLSESFQFAITDPNYGPLPPGLAPYDLAHGGSLFNFHGARTIGQYGFYLSDSIKLARFTVSAGLRDDQYNGLITANGLQPRLGISYLVPKTSTVLRIAYARTFETPFNENLILSSGTGAGGLAQNLFGSVSAPIKPGIRNQFNTGLQQQLGHWLIVDADYFWKFTQNGYDFAVLFNTPITFPVSWNKSKLDGVTARVSTVNIHGFQAYMTLGHTRARYFPPEVGGLIPLSGFPTSVFRIDHDQAFQQTAALRYQRPHNAEWFEFTWRYDSGMVVSGVPDVAAATQLTPSQQVDIGFACNGVAATLQNPISSCNGTGTSTLLTLPQTGTANPDHNPDRVRPRNLLNVAIGTDNLFHREQGACVTLRLSVENLTNQVALYNFLSTFSGTHFVAPRSYQLTLGYVF